MFTFFSPSFWTGLVASLKPPVKFPFDPDSPNILLPVTLVHHGATTQVHLALDTGASITVLDDDLAAALGLNSQRKTITVATASGTIRAYQTAVDELTVLDRTQENAPILIAALTDTGIDGLLGLSFLKHYKLTLDSQNHHLTLK